MITINIKTYMLTIILFIFMLPAVIAVTFINASASDQSLKCWDLASYEAVTECYKTLCKLDKVDSKMDCLSKRNALESKYLSNENKLKTKCSVTTMLKSSELTDIKSVKKKCIENIPSKFIDLAVICRNEVVDFNQEIMTYMEEFSTISNCAEEQFNLYVDNLIMSESQWYIDMQIHSDADQVFSLGKRLYDKRKFKESFMAYLRAAELGSVEAMLKVAELYEIGFGIDKNLEEAQKWYMEAAENGNWDAQIKLREIEVGN